MSEIWELVDIYGNATGVVIERNTNTRIPQNMYHIAVDIWVKRKDGKILLTQRHPNKEWGLQWECSGGAIVKGESISEGAQRELQEETGIAVSINDLQYLGKTIMQENQCIMYTYLVMLEEDMKLKLQKNEVIAAKWMEIEEIENMQEKIVKSVWARYLQFKEQIVKV